MFSFLKFSPYCFNFKIVCNNQLHWVDVVIVLFCSEPWFFSLLALNDNHFFFAGQIMAMSLVHGGPAPYFLSPLVYDALLFGPRQVTVS